MLLITGECYQCTEGYYCETPGLVNPTGPCQAGFYCISGANTSTPTDGVTGDACRQGYYCLQGSSEGKTTPIYVRTVGYLQ